MPLRLLHTSDWHLGHELNGFSRIAEHARFLVWLEETLAERSVDALLVTGDIFDKQNPSSEAQRLLFDFLGRVKRRLPALDVVLIAGNHDSAGRLEAPSPVLDAFGVRVIGSLGSLGGGEGGGPGGDGDAAAVERLLCPLSDAAGRRRAIVAAVPFLRPADLPPPPADGAESPANDPPANDPRGREGSVGDPLVWGVGEVYRRVIAAARRRCDDGEALIVTGHCYMTGGAVSELSERRILGGHQHALPAAVFPDDVAYVALGHLHKPQSVGGRPHVRYAGAPLPLAVDERGYRHQVVLVTLAAGAAAAIEPILVPRTVAYWRVPDEGAASAEEIAQRLQALPADSDPGWEARPFLDVAVRLEKPAPALRQTIEAALAGKFVRLVRLQTLYPAAAAGDTLAVAPDLLQLQPEDVFRMCYHETFRRPPEAALLADFRDLVAAAEQALG